MKIRISSEENGMYVFYCPGCKHSHIYYTKGDMIWNFNNNLEYPTFTPSLLNYIPTHENGIEISKGEVCHMYVTDGKIIYLSDCFHEYAGQTIDMEDVNP